MHEYMEEFLHLAVTLVRVIVATLIGCLKALLPMGFLPRKGVNGQVCLITGAGSGLGRLMAIEFAKQGCTLVLWDLNEKGNEETKIMLGKSGVKVYTYTLDLSKNEEINATAEKVKKEVGEVDILINNAGIVTGKKIFECPDELMEKTVAVNCNACLFTAKNFVKSMIEKNNGHIVTIASIAGKGGTAGLVDYCASKHGAVGFHESLSAELRNLNANGVKTTVVCPYYINTGMFDGVVTKSPNVMPLLEPEYVVECILEAVLTNKEEIQIPRFMYLTTAFAGILPTEAKMIWAEYFGLFETMDHFVGRKEIKA
ncbi:hypothetical protein PENTCL1PPCAC_14818 [Pristionchus entomophagus]|uniref:Uncharacterized protein n=1 Tax=Pristionchus entomophagus TaxID=358040 RepID=A0AAV5TBT5_9BILA|nr:hypothetical protein PENTCL1PPCAC_14818 [Pristionchus entomophagus]